MKTIFTIIKKELSRIFKSPTTIISLFLLPALFIFLIYQLIGNGIRNQTEANLKIKPDVVVVLDDEAVREKITTINEIANPLGTLDIDFADFSEQGIAELKDNLKAMEVDFLVICNDSSETYEFYYNSSNKINDMWLNIVDAQISESLVETRYYSLNPLGLSDIIPADEAKVNGQLLIMASIIPMLIMSFLFQGAMSVAPESIAGEKERGTISTLLSTPIKSSTIALGKIISLIILATLCAISSFIGVVFSLPNMMMDDSFSFSMYGAGNIVLIFVVIFVTVALIVSIVSNISAVAKSVQQASTLSLPLLFISMLVGISTMLTNGAAQNTFLYLIPIFNSSQILFQIFTLQLNVAQLLVTIFSNIAYVGIFIFTLSLLFRNEKAMFNK